MIAAVFAAFLVLLTVPALLPTWRQFAGAAALIIILLVVGMTLVLRDLDAHPSGGDGPAFFALAFLFGLAQAAVVASVLGRAFVRWLALRLHPATARRLVRSLVICGALPIVLMAVLSVSAPDLARLAVVLSFLSYPLLWVGVALKLAPNNSSKPTPLRGAA